MGRVRAPGGGAAARPGPRGRSLRRGWRRLGRWGSELSPPERFGWLDYAVWRGGRPHTVVGRLLVRPDLESPQLGRRRDLFVHLAPSLATGARERRYPVVYMHDGQNLFDAATSNDGEWRVDETMTALAAEGIEALVVGVPHSGEERMDEYAPMRDRDRRKGGRGDRYLEFLVDAVKPLVDGAFPTLDGPEHTGLIGSSMGGLISLHGLIARPDIFGFAGVMSPALWFAERSFLDRARALRPGAVRLYLDVGGREGPDVPGEADEWARRYLTDARALRAQLEEQGFREGEDLLYVEDDEAPHHESAWAARLPDALRFLLRRAAVRA